MSRAVQTFRRGVQGGKPPLAPLPHVIVADLLLTCWSFTWSEGLIQVYCLFIKDECTVGNQ